MFQVRPKTIQEMMEVVNTHATTDEAERAHFHGDKADDRSNNRPRRDFRHHDNNRPRKRGVEVFAIERDVRPALDDFFRSLAATTRTRSTPMASAASSGKHLAPDQLQRSQEQTIEQGTTVGAATINVATTTTDAASTGAATTTTTTAIMTIAATTIAVAK